MRLYSIRKFKGGMTQAEENLRQGEDCFNAVGVFEDAERL